MSEIKTVVMEPFGVGEFTSNKGVKVKNGANSEIFNDYNTNIATGNNSHAEGHSNVASGETSHAEGSDNTASGSHSHAEGYQNTANGDFSHVEGISCTTNNSSAHAEGNSTKALGLRSHAEGLNTEAQGAETHAEGREAIAVGDVGHAEGWDTIAKTLFSHTEGSHTYAYGEAAHAEGNLTKANGNSSHAEGGTNLIVNDGAYAHIEGYNNYIQSAQGHAEGYKNYLSGGAAAAHIEGSENMAMNSDVHVEGYHNVAIGNAAHSEGHGNAYFTLQTETSEATPKYPHSVRNIQYYNGLTTNYQDAKIILSNDIDPVVLNDLSVAEHRNRYNYATGIGSHAEGGWVYACGDAAHAEGQTLVDGNDIWLQQIDSSTKGAHVEGAGNSILSGSHHSHAEGRQNILINTNTSHAEGVLNTIDGSAGLVHIEGSNNRATNGSQLIHIEGRYNLATNGAQNSRVCGESNNLTTTTNSSIEGQYNHIDGQSQCCHIEGIGNQVSGGSNGSHIEGLGLYDKIIELSSSLMPKWIARTQTIFEPQEYIINSNGAKATYRTTKLGQGNKYCHVEGIGCSINNGVTLSGLQSGCGNHVEGIITKVIGTGLHGEGVNNLINNANAAHIEGFGNTINNWVKNSEDTSNAEVDCLNSVGAHSEGVSTVAANRASHAQNLGTIANAQGQTALGRFNIKDTSATGANPSGNYAIIVGNGSITGITIDDYDTTKNYDVDNYVIYNNIVYKCLEATTGDFDSTKWSKTDGEVFNNKIVNRSNAATLTWNGYLDVSGGFSVNGTPIGGASGDIANPNISDEYSSFSTYKVGDYCIYNNTLYKCNTAITVGETFDSTKWTTTTIGSELLAIISRVSALEIALNGYSFANTMTETQYEQITPDTNTIYPIVEE